VEILPELAELSPVALVALMGVSCWRGVGIGGRFTFSFPMICSKA